MKEAQGNQASIDDYSVASFIFNLEYIYCGTISADIDSRQLPILIEIADRYLMADCLEHLLVHLERQILTTDHIAEVIDIYMELSKKIHCPAITRTCESSLERLLLHHPGCSTLVDILIVAHRYGFATQLKKDCMYEIKDFDFEERLKAHPDLRKEILEYWRE